MKISPQVYTVDGITPPAKGWKYVMPAAPRITSSGGFHHGRYSIYYPAVIAYDGKIALFDTGTPDSLPRIKECIENLGLGLKDIKSIIISHTHVDHLGELKHLVDLTHARVYAHELEVPYLLKKAIPERDPRYYEAVNIDVPLRDGDNLDILGGLKTIHTPGHTPGHIALYSEKHRLLLAADLIRHSRGEFHLPPPEYSTDYAAIIKSLVKVSRYDFNTLVLYHGEPIMENASNRLKEFVEYLKGISDIFEASVRDALIGN